MPTTHADRSFESKRHPGQDEPTPTAPATWQRLRPFALGVLPGMLLALLLTGLLTAQRARTLREEMDLRVGLRLEQLALALAVGERRDPQALLEGALPSHPGAPLRRIEWQPDANHLYVAGDSAIDGTEAWRRYERRIAPPGHAAQVLRAYLDPQPLERRVLDAWLAGGGCGAALALLTGLMYHHLYGRPDEAKAAHADSPPGLPAAAPSTIARAGRSMPEDAEGTPGQSHFIAQVGHHFRQPLHALQLLTASLPDDGGLRPGFSAQIRTSIGAMTRLLDALLELARLEAGVVTPSAADFSAQDLFLRDRFRLAGEAARHGAVLLWRGGHHRLHGDLALSAGLLRQLVSNALVHAAGRRVLVAARRQGDAVRIEVRDAGPGIDVADHARIFEEFVQLPAGQDAARAGYGLGLPIAVRHARLLRTRIDLRSAPGRGSLFWFTLPAARHAGASVRPERWPVREIG
ncbi:sensor histidine kinase [Frateuria defendens]|uniref:sensor histidine kinase n=1 Tax=Frateuria defendens TaxID=2219559 RepID=UPI00066FF77C|nr:HAMP domain-containing sensor histidine kinase [Frateuria defendens]